MSARNDHEGLVLGRYRLEGVIARGGGSNVHRGRDVTSGEAVAVKEIPLSGEMARRAGAEVRAASLLDHPAVVPLVDFGEDDHACYLISELVDGVSLAQHLRGTATALTDAQATAVAADVLLGLAHAHARGVTHRDVKPGNVLVDGRGRGRLTDFGIARIAGEAGLTVAGGLVGTVSYMAPEQAQGQATGPASDVYSLSLVLYECLAGHNPVAAATPGETLRKAAHEPIPPLRSHRPDLPAALCAAVDSGLARAPERRPDATALAHTLQTHAPTLNSVTRRRPASTRSVWTVRAGIAGAAAVLAGLVLPRFHPVEPTALTIGAVAVGVAFAAAPWPTAIVAWIAAMVGIGLHAPAAAVIVGALGLVALAPARRHGRLTLLAAFAPVLMTLGVVTVFPLLAGLVRDWRWRAWTAATGMLAAIGWSAIAGADPGVDGGRVNGEWDALRDVMSPITALDTILSPLRGRPSIVIAAALIGASALAIPLVRRLPLGVPRLIGVVVWLALLTAAVASGGGSLENAVGAFIPGGILVGAWAVVSWRRLTRIADRREAATIRPTVERLPAA